MGFCEPNDITTDIREPDLLQITFKLPGVIIDSQDFTSLDREAFVYTVPLKPQKSKSDLEELASIAKTAVNIATALSFWQIVLFFVLGEAL